MIDFHQAARRAGLALFLGLTLTACGGGEGGGGSEAASGPAGAALSAGKALASAGKHFEALEAYKEGLSDQTPELVIAIGQSLFALERYGEAAEMLASAAQRHPEHAEIALNLGLVHLKSANLSAAARELGKAAELDPGRFEAHLNLGRTLYDRSIIVLGPSTPVDQEKLDAAIAAFEKAIAIKPDDAEARFRAALAYDRKNQPEAAIDHLRTASRRSPGHVRARRLLGQLLVETGAVDEGRKELESVLALDPRSAETLFQLGVAREEGGDDAGALTAYQQAIEALPCYTDAFFRQAAVLRRLGREEEAKAAQLAFEHFEQKEESLRSNRIAAMASPKDAMKQHELGLALLELMRMDEARTCFRRALELEPMLVGSNYALGRILFEQGDLPGALDQYRNVRLGAPDEAIGLMELSQVYFQLQDRANARKTIEELIEIEPENADARVRMFEILMQAGDRAAAVAELEAALAADPDHVRATFNLGSVAVMNKDLEGAVGYYERTLELDPTHAKAKQLLEGIRRKLGQATEGAGNG